MFFDTKMIFVCELLRVQVTCSGKFSFWDTWNKKIYYHENILRCALKAWVECSLSVWETGVQSQVVLDTVMLKTQHY